jgi:hypothetical protein
MEGKMESLAGLDNENPLRCGGTFAFFVEMGYCAPLQ